MGKISYRSLKKTLQKWAKQSGFIRRKRKLSGLGFLVMMTVVLCGITHPSLAALIDSVKANISREGLHLRFTKNAVVFMRKCVTEVLRKKVGTFFSLNAVLLKSFNKIHVVDSTSWDINAALKSVLPGCGGAASAANCKVHLCYEYLHGILSFFEIVPGKKTDNIYSSQLPELVGQNELLIADLGYFCMNSFWRICQKGGFFIFRLLVSTTLFNPKTLVPIDLCSTLKKAVGNAFELSVMMGKDEKTRTMCRLICLRVDDKTANKRRRQLRKKARKNKRTPSERHLYMANWIVMVTNVPQEVLPADMVRPFYSLRWQIELLFKQLKSVLNITTTNTANENRFHCELLGRLIVAILIHRVHASANAQLWNSDKQEISMEKFYKRFQERIFMISQLMMESSIKAKNYINIEIARVLKNCRKLRQKSRLSTLEFLEFTKEQAVERLEVILLT